MFDFTEEEIKRYSRHIILPEIGGTGQSKLKKARVLCVGLGGLGSPVALYLAAAGIGTLGLIDMDKVDISNLQRQVIHSTKDIGRLKVESAKEKIKAINPGVTVNTYTEAISSKNVKEVIAGYDIVIDGCDNFATRYLVNDACFFAGKPNVYGSVFRFEGRASLFCKEGPCYRCMHPHPPPPGEVPSCEEAGVLGVLPGIIGVIQATEAIKHILGIGRSLKGRLLLYDALDMSFREVKIKKDRNCPLCGDNQTVKDLIDYKQFCGLK
ncbi:molybdopterin-synthase adenylyltransferase MoeB [Candidatus Woesearchaeota archaeon]|nr:molybdopterin-synthase adenylyltransferase MoeB [Candidatus Woesearchaeota archaeon]